VAIQDILINNIDPPSNVLMIGKSETIIDELRMVYNITMLSEYRNVFRAVECHYVPILRSLDWYDPRVLAKYANKIKAAEVVIVVGPDNMRASGLLQWRHLFPLRAMWIWDKADALATQLTYKTISKFAGREVIAEDKIAYMMGAGQ